MEDVLENKANLVEIELELDETTMAFLKLRSNFMGITVEELVVNILEEGFKDEVTKRTKQVGPNSPTKLSIR